MSNSANAAVSEEQPRSGGWAGFAVSCFVQVVLSFAAFGALILSDFAYDACGTAAGDRTCNYDLNASGHNVLVLGLVILGVAVAAAAALRSRRKRSVWWLPLLASGGVVALAAITICLNLAGADALRA
jgi:hypothetical protein